MISDTQVVFRNIEYSPSVEEIVLKRLGKLERYCDEIHSLRVILETPHNNHHKGKVYHVGVEAMVPNHDIVVTHDQHDNHAHEDIYVAIRDAFDAIERRLKSVYGKQRRRMTKNTRKLGETISVLSVAEAEAANP
jgi:ribosomal subunit interface protein